MIDSTTMRDIFWDRIYEIAKEDRDVCIVCADMGAPSLDKFRDELKNQYINVGIAEQNAVLIATGLALQGKKVYIYALAPFITMRCYEQIRNYVAGMNLPITIVGVGAGVCYHESGPTHHSVEDITLLRCLPHMTVLSASDNVMTKAFADFSYQSKTPNYIRLDRMRLPQIYPPQHSFEEGVYEVVPTQEITLLSTGCTTSNILEAQKELEKLGIKVGVIDAYKIPFDEEKFLDIIKNVSKMITVEEHTLPGGFGSYIGEILLDNEINCKLKRLGLDLRNGYCYSYGGRGVIQKEYGIDSSGIVDVVKAMV